MLVHVSAPNCSLDQQTRCSGQGCYICAMQCAMQTHCHQMWLSIWEGASEATGMRGLKVKYNFGFGHNATTNKSYRVAKSLSPLADPVTLFSPEVRAANEQKNRGLIQKNG